MEAVNAVNTGAAPAAGNAVWYIMACVVVVLVIAALILWKRLKKKRLKPWNEMLAAQRVLDELNEREVLSWAQDARNACGANQKMMLASATPKWVEKLGYCRPAQLDENRNVIACVVDMADGSVDKLRLFSFDRTSPKVNEWFNERDVFFLDS